MHRHYNHHDWSHDPKPRPDDGRLGCGSLITAACFLGLGAWASWHLAGWLVREVGF